MQRLQRHDQVTVKYRRGIDLGGFDSHPSPPPFVVLTAERTAKMTATAADASGLPRTTGRR
jgi:hypothetical protein